MLVLCIIFLTFSVKQETAWASSSTGWLQNSIAWTRPRVKDRIFLTKLLFESEAASTVGCASKCVATEGCIFFTYTKTLPPLSYPCRGHSSVMEAESTAVASFGTKAFSFTKESLWLEKVCSTSTECGATNAECYKGSCLCVPGHYYSHRADSCVDSCAEEDQQQTLLLYPDSGISVNTKSLKGYTLQQCFDECLSDPSCLSMDHSQKKQKCCTHDVTALDVPSKWVSSANGWDFYQKSCL